MIAWALSRIAFSSAVAVAAGLPLVAPRGRPTAGHLAAAWTVALGNASVLALAAGLAGLPLSPAIFLALLIAPGAVAAAFQLRKPTPAGAAGRPIGEAPAGLPRTLSAGHRPAAGGPAAAHSGGDSALLWLSRIALACALGVLLWKLIRVPLWGWDHFAVWGVKARRMLEAGHLRLDFLTSLYQTRTDHPLGIPMAWLVLTLGHAPSPVVFKVLHTIFALALVAVVHAATHRLGFSAAVANAMAGALAISPLLWDTELVGLCEVPLALWALAALLLLLPRQDEPAGHRLWVPGLIVGFLPWVKQEGLFLGLLLLLPAARLLRNRGRRITLANFAQLAAPAVLLAAGALAIQRFILPPGASFFVGPWLQRGLGRLPQTFAILRQCAGDLLQPDWLGFWVFLAVATLVAAVTKKTLTLSLAAVVWSQVLIYALTAFFSYLMPFDHLRAAYFRICSALEPIGLLAIAALFQGRAAQIVTPSVGLEAEGTPGERRAA
jgi:hypothetical protein